jgi:mono/diheme cytochrome c family protein
VHDPEPRNLPRWLGAGLVAGLIVIGIAAAAYAVGYHRGQRHNRTGAPSATTTTAATTGQPTTAPATTTSTSTVAVTPALIAQGRQLYSADGCSSCHSLTGTPGAGPSFKGLAGSSVKLSTGQTVTADDAYLEQSITNPDAQIVQGYHSGLMAPAISGFGLANKPDQVRALVAFIKSQK